MQIIDIHAHIYQRVAGITQGQPMASTSLGRVTIGNREVQFLPPSFDQTSSKAETLIAYMDWCGVDKALLMPNPYYGYHNAYFEESAKQYPGRLKGIASCLASKLRQTAPSSAPPIKGWPTRNSLPYGIAATNTANRFFSICSGTVMWRILRRCWTIIPILRL